MSLTKKQARALLAEHDLRATAPRIAVLQLLASARGPLSYSDVLQKMGKTDWDPATIFRNLVKLREAGVAPVVSRADGIDRYVIKSSQHDGHNHPHFACDDCGELICLPFDVTDVLAVPGRWSKSVETAMIQLRGQCPDCLV